MADPAATRRLVLASSSPSRLSVVRSAGIEPLVRVPDVDEDAVVAELRSGDGDAGPGQTVVHLAEAKARAVCTRFAADLPVGALVVAGDSMLLLDGELQGKPHTVERTVQRWRQQRGRSAVLVTGQAAVLTPATGDGPGEMYSASSSTVVHFAAATDPEIEAYAATGEPLECAGAFTLEALGGWFIDRIDGDPSSVIGLSLPVLRRAVRHFGLTVPDFWNGVHGR